MIFIAAAGLGNVASVKNMIAKVGGGECRIVTEPEALRTAGKIILPGVGSFDAGMEALERTGMVRAIREAAERGASILGICLGMQLLFHRSEEGRLPGLGLMGGRVMRFRQTGGSMKIPHVGWNKVRPLRESPIFSMGLEEQRFYHVHSYHVECDDPGDIAATTNYGYEFTSAVHHGSVMGVQFHPEKSHRFGMALMKRFVELGAC